MQRKATNLTRGRKGTPGMKIKASHGVGGDNNRKHVLGTTAEGIDILKPRGNPSNFTWQEIREAVASVLEQAPA